MGKFAKLIELEGGEQVLLTVEGGENDDEVILNVRTEFEGVSAVIGLVYPNENEAISVMESYSVDRAHDFRDKMEDYLK